MLLISFILLYRSDLVLTQISFSLPGKWGSIGKRTAINDQSLTDVSRSLADVTKSHDMTSSSSQCGYNDPESLLKAYRFFQVTQCCLNTALN